MVSRSGLMCRPCSTVSSPVLTTTVSSSGGTTLTIPRSRRAAPTPPARAVIMAAMMARAIAEPVIADTLCQARAVYGRQVLLVVEQLRRAVPGGIGTYVRGLLQGLDELGEMGESRNSGDSGDSGQPGPGGQP